MNVLLVTVIVFLSAFQINAYPNGAPKKVCTGPMIPHHHHIDPQPLDTSPITTFSTVWNADQETVSIRIESKQPIKGIFVQGRKVDGDEPLGTFTDIPSTTHLVQCPTGDGLTHSSPQQWKELQFTWKKPALMVDQEEIQFWATIVVDFKTFWVVKSTSVTLTDQTNIAILVDMMKSAKKLAFRMAKWTKSKLFD